MLDVNHITFLGTRIALATIIRAFNACHMGKGRVELGILVDQYLIALRSLLLEINLQNESSFFIFLLIPTIATQSHQFVLFLMEI